MNEFEKKNKKRNQKNNELKNVIQNEVYKEGVENKVFLYVKYELIILLADSSSSKGNMALFFLLLS